MNAIMKTAQVNPEILQTLKLHIQMGIGAEAGEDKSVEAQIRIAQIDREFKEILNGVTAENQDSLRSAGIWLWTLPCTSTTAYTTPPRFFL